MCTGPKSFRSPFLTLFMWIRINSSIKKRIQHNGIIKITPPAPLLKSLKNCFKISETLACPQGFQCGIRGTCIVDPLLPKTDPKCRCEKGYSYMKDGKCVGKLKCFYVTLIPSHAKTLPGCYDFNLSYLRKSRIDVILWCDFLSEETLYLSPYPGRPIFIFDVTIVASLLP